MATTALIIWIIKTERRSKNCQWSSDLVLSCNIVCIWLGIICTKQHAVVVIISKLYNDQIFERQTPVKNTYRAYYPCYRRSALFYITNRHYTVTIQWSIESLIIQHLNCLLFLQKQPTLILLVRKKFTDSKQGCSNVKHSVEDQVFINVNIVGKYSHGVALNI